jgi:hypothetical protein
MYDKYTTEALVLHAREHGERDKIFALYTRDFGLVHARASAVCTMHSRMRPALTLFAPALVSLVRGTRGWRIAGARAGTKGNLRPEGAHTFARIVQLLLRLVRGEECNRYVFEALSGARDVLAHMEASGKASEKERVATTELLCVARILYGLGYISPHALTSALFTHAHYQPQDFAVVEQTRTDILVRVNGAIAESQL